jgi:hypothetical protein
MILFLIRVQNMLRVENVVSHLKVKWSVPYRKLVDYFGFHPQMKLTTMKYITEIDTIYIYIFFFIEVLHL